MGFEQPGLLEVSLPRAGVLELSGLQVHKSFSVSVISVISVFFGLKGLWTALLSKVGLAGKDI